MCGGQREGSGSLPSLQWPENVRKRTVPATPHGGGQRAQGEPKLGAVRASQAARGRPRGSGPQTRSWGYPPLLGYRKTWLSLSEGSSVMKKAWGTRIPNPQRPHPGQIQMVWKPQADPILKALFKKGNTKFGQQARKRVVWVSRDHEVCIFLALWRAHPCTCMWAGTGPLAGISRSETRDTSPTGDEVSFLCIPHLKREGAEVLDCNYVPQTLPSWPRSQSRGTRERGRRVPPTHPCHQVPDLPQTGAWSSPLDQPFEGTDWRNV